VPGPSANLITFPAWSDACAAGEPTSSTDGRQPGEQAREHAPSANQGAAALPLVCGKEESCLAAAGREPPTQCCETAAPGGEKNKLLIAADSDASQRPIQLRTLAIFWRPHQPQAPATEISTPQIASVRASGTAAVVTSNRALTARSGCDLRIAAIEVTTWDLLKTEWRNVDLVTAVDEGRREA
jgi:hypothetical protein